MEKIGRFSIDEEMIRYRPHEVTPIFSKMGLIVVRAEMSYVNRAIDYTAICEAFDPVGDGEIPAKYSIMWEEKRVETGGIVKTSREFRGFRRIG